jgi:hypothetical protein
MVEEEDVIKCSICGYTTSEKALLDHSMYDMDDGTFQCSSCYIGKDEK